MRLTVHGGHLIQHPSEPGRRASHAPPLADEERARRGVDRPPRAAPAADLPWTGVRNYQARNFMRDDHAARRRRALLPLVVPAAGHRRPGARGRRAAARRHAVRPASPYHDAKSTRRNNRAGCRSTCAGAQDTAAGLPRCAPRPTWPRCACCNAATGCPSPPSRPPSGSSPCWRCSAGATEAGSRCCPPRGRSVARTAGPELARWWPSCWRWARWWAFWPGCWAWAAA
jgi:hypothetical protein